MLQKGQMLMIKGPAGDLETQFLPPVEAEAAQARGFAILLHPNPLQGGTHTNKVIQTAAKSLNQLGYAVYLPNLRGVGNSGGVHDYGQGEVEDVAAVLAFARTRHPEVPWVLGGFSFGGYVALRATHLQPQGLLLVAPAVCNYAEPAPPVPPQMPTLIVQGDADEVTPAAKLSAWLEPQGLGYMCVPGAEHFFHGKLIVLGRLITAFWRW